jgi:hypothetical protein
MRLRFQHQRPERLLVLRQVLAQNIPKRLGLLGAQKDRVVIADGHLLGRIAAGEPEDELKIPYADPHLHAVGIGFAEVRRLGHINLRLLRRSIHDEPRLLCPVPGQSDKGTEGQKDGCRFTSIEHPPKTGLSFEESGRGDSLLM